MTQSKRIFGYVIFSVLLLMLGGVAGYRLRERGGVQQLSSNPAAFFKVTATAQPSEYKEIRFDQFWEVWRILEQKYLDPNKLAKDQMVYGAIQGMTASIGDPYTYFLKPVDQKRTEEDLHGSFFGVGIQLGYIDGVLAVQSPLKGSPAERAGIKAQDLILKVKDEKTGKEEETAGWSLSQAVDKIRGDRGTRVTLTIFRKSEKAQPFPVTLERGEIVVPSAELAVVEKDGKKIAHITISRFGDRTQDELNNAIREVSTQNPKVAGIVLDMRNNPGGYLDGAVDVAGEFMKSGTVVTQQGRFSSQSYSAKGAARLASYPLVVLVNGGSASASEIVAGAMRDQREAKLVGEKTFGKGTVQDAMELGGGAGLHVTIARWILPKGDWINEKGIPVDTEVKDDPQTPADEQLDKAIEVLLQSPTAAK